jgi:hypothetical protein
MAGFDTEYSVGLGAGVSYSDDALTAYASAERYASGRPSSKILATT